MPSPTLDELFPGPTELAALMRRKDWSATSLGPPDGWPHSLKTIVRVVLTSRFAMWMGWGPDLTFLYNDAYAAMTLGAKHPWALGRPSREVWAEIWPEIGPRIEHVLQSGEATWDEDLLLFLERSGYAEETYHTFSYSPVNDDAGSVCGLLCVVTEQTDRVIAERRMALLRDTAAAVATINDESELFRALQRALDQGIALKEIGRAVTNVAIRMSIQRENGNLQRAARCLGVTDRALQMRRAHNGRDLAAD